MKNKTARAAVLSVAALAFWLAVWQLVSMKVDAAFIFPPIGDILRALGRLLQSRHFYSTVLSSFMRIISGLAIGVALGALLAPLTRYLFPFRVIFSPVMTVIRATPVASFIMILWVLIGSDSVPTTVTALMVTPIIWQNLSDGFSSVDQGLSEVCEIYNIRGFRRFRILVAPTLVKYLIPGIITSAGLAWKSGIAAEIISYTSNSIGKEIYLAKAYLESGEMLAWTTVVVILSLVFETLLGLLGRRLTNGKLKT